MTDKRFSAAPAAECSELDFDEEPLDASLAAPFDWQRFSDAVKAVWVRRRRVLWATFVGAVLSLVIALVWPPYYESTARIIPPEANKDGLSMLRMMSDNVIGLMGGELGGASPSGQLYVTMLRSRNMLDKVIARCSLQQSYKSKYMTTTRKRLLASTEVAEDRKSGTIQIVVTDRDKQRAAAIAKAYVEELSLLAGELNTSAAHRERVFLENRLKTVTSDLKLSEERFSKFASERGAINLEQQAKAMLEGAARLQGELIAAESELRGMQQIYTPNNMRMRTMQARVDELKHQLRDMGGKPGAGANDAMEDTDYPSIRALPALGVTYADLYRDLKIQEAVFQTLTKQNEMTKVQEAQEMPAVKVIDAPEVPEFKTGPSRALILVMGTFAAFIGVLLWVVLQHMWMTWPDDDPRKATVRAIVRLPRQGRAMAAGSGA